MAPLTVEDAVDQAIRHNPRLAAAIGDVQAGRSGVGAARALANPSVTFTPAVIGRFGSDTELLIQQPLEINGARGARAGVASAQYRATQALAIVELRSLVFQTKSAYYELEHAREQNAVARELLQGAQEFNRITRQQVEVGTRPGVDQIQTGIEVTRAQQQVTVTDGQVATATAALDTLMGHLPSEPVGPLSSLAYTPQAADADTAMHQALASRAEIQAETANRDVFRQQARQGRAEGLPDLVPQYRASSITRGGIRESGIGIGINLPLLDYGSRRERVRQADQSAAAADSRIQAAQDQVRQEVAQALARLAAADAVVRSYQKGVLGQARSLLDASRVGLQEGHTSVIALIEAQRTYRSVQTEYTNALVDAAIARAELERATGAVPAALLSR